MISVKIEINGNVIFARSAVNLDQKDEQGRTLYKVDTGRILKHKRETGAVKLAIKMLKTIKEVTK